MLRQSETPHSSRDSDVDKSCPVLVTWTGSPSITVGKAVPPTKDPVPVPQRTLCVEFGYGYGTLFDKGGAGESGEKRATSEVSRTELGINGSSICELPSSAPLQVV
ncbi:hypothetical protein EJ05DRAFT_480852 [Pseudovirgaria hyperparasitica]|uniref:Uncharacterized protein n=1 Tax=Pseudovirgaria hyperparasitica TaxID=470096 RepID=A0A6A6VT26_9PEZI|nr:uncharacterized protein EJ05DRAFT_480852 [Pseudovirgaria hyperparasitica]KAF2752936.1 hypothetical protein EJ05DRAFT_480852 [Pseudovirgaria hyperparasitica]